jgi:hypothetical protein
VTNKFAWSHYESPFSPFSAPRLGQFGVILREVQQVSEGQVNQYALTVIIVIQRFDGFGKPQADPVFAAHTLGSGVLIEKRPAQVPK